MLKKLKPQYYKSMHISGAMLYAKEIIFKNKIAYFVLPFNHGNNEVPRGINYCLYGKWYKFKPEKWLKKEIEECLKLELDIRLGGRYRKVKKLK